MTTIPMVQQAAAKPFEILAPAAWSAPLVFNSPHSGRCYDAAFLKASRLSPMALRKSEDSFVDELFLDCLTHGAPMLRAHVPRSFVDLNREPYELDPRLFDGDLPGYANITSARVAGGLGTIPRIVAEGEEIYRGRLSLADGLARIERIYLPYHRTLAALVAEVTGKNGAMLLLDCHSMPSSAATHVHPPVRAPIDVVLGDRFGQSCNEEITGLVERLLSDEGLTVLRNRPYAGGFITHSYGAPSRGHHALQIEINRALYLDETSLEKTVNFAELKRALSRVIGELAQEVGNLFEPGRIAAE
jgi:N-formylglutamate deformylase